MAMKPILMILECERPNDATVEKLEEAGYVVLFVSKFDAVKVIPPMEELNMSAFQAIDSTVTNSVVREHFADNVLKALISRKAK